MINPDAGLEMEFRCAVVNLGGKNPLFSDFISNMADGSGSELSKLRETPSETPVLGGAPE